MDISKRYEELYKKVLDEHRQVFEKLDMGELTRFIEAIEKVQRIFVMGVGREGISARSFAMRLMHLGKEVHWVWDDTTPGMAKGDLFIAISGPGYVGHHHYVVERAVDAGATIAVVTGTPKGRTPRLADYVLFVPGQVYNGTDDRCVPFVQPMGALFEQHTYLLYDIIIMMLEEKMNLTHEEMESRHRNVE